MKDLITSHPPISVINTWVFKTQIKSQCIFATPIQYMYKHLSVNSICIVKDWMTFGPKINIIYHSSKELLSTTILPSPYFSNRLRILWRSEQEWSCKKKSTVGRGPASPQDVVRRQLLARLGEGWKWPRCRAERGQEKNRTTVLIRHR